MVTKFTKLVSYTLRTQQPLPNKFNMFQPTLDKLIAIPGDKYCEYKLGLTKDLEPCDFFAI
jgi:hypothetical protein